MMLQLLAAAVCVGLCSASGCTSPWKEYNGHCYWRSDAAHSWDYANANCPPGSKLASIHSQQENEFLLLAYSHQNSWIGFNDKDGEGNFVWSDGTIRDYTNWENFQPDDKGGADCVRFPHPDHIDRGKWDDTVCSDSHNYICKMSAAAIDLAELT